MVTYTLLRLIAVAFLVALNAFFVAAEFALVSVRETRLLQLIDANKIGARTVQRLHHRLDEVLAAVQLGVTVASLALGWIGESAIARLFQPYFARLPHGRVLRPRSRRAFRFTLITFFHVTLGEVVPKTIALQRAEQVALAVAAPMEVFITHGAPGAGCDALGGALRAASLRHPRTPRRWRAFPRRAEADGHAPAASSVSCRRCRKR